jgi:hypothetical protein
MFTSRHFCPHPASCTASVADLGKEFLFISFQLKLPCCTWYKDLFSLNCAQLRHGFKKQLKFILYVVNTVNVNSWNFHCVIRYPKVFLLYFEKFRIQKILLNYWIAFCIYSIWNNFHRNMPVSFGNTIIFLNILILLLNEEWPSHIKLQHSVSLKWLNTGHISLQF